MSSPKQSPAMFAARMSRLMRGEQDVVSESSPVSESPWLHYAALSGQFDPWSFEAASAQELNALSRLCTVEPAAEGVRWLMRGDARTEAIRTMLSEGSLKTMLLKTLPVTDLTGLMLRRVLNEGVSINIEALDDEQGKALETVLEWLREIHIPKPDETSLKSSRERKDFFEPYDVLLQRGFVGREKDLEKLYTFLSGPGSTSWRWEGAILTGLGGVGKSTLLAKFAQESRLSKLVTLALLDFDRPGLDGADPYCLEMEISRQIGYQFPEHEQHLKQARVRARQQFDQDSSATRQYRNLLLDPLRTLLPQGRPFLLILDTFEEVSQRDLTLKMLDWLNEICEYIKSLKVVFSGRLYDSALSQLKPHAPLLVELDVVPKVVAKSYLMSRGVTEEMADRVVRAESLPLRFLELKLIARLIQDGDSGIIAMLESEAKVTAGAAEQLFTSLVYRRVLNRIPDPAVRELAYPGLILRYIDAELIQHVLAPVLKLTQLEEREAAEDAIEKLAAYEWLAFREGGKVWHRKDLRRSMLHAMIAKEGERTRKIQDAAIEHFRQPGKDHREAVYHQLMRLESGQSAAHLTITDLEQAGTSIRVDMADLPVHSRALLRLAMGEEIGVAETLVVPHPYRKKAYDERGKALMSSLQFGTAAGLAMQGPIEEPWEREALWATAEWDRLRSHLNSDDIDAAFYSAFVAEPVPQDPLWLVPGDKVQRLCIASVMSNDRIPPPGSFDNDNLSQAAQRRITLACLQTRPLYLIVEPHQPYLNLPHMEHMRNRLAGTTDPKLTIVLQAAVQAVAELNALKGRISVRGLLNMESKTQNYTVNLGFLSNFEDRALLYDLMRFPNPEFRDPVRFAWLAAFPGSAGHGQLCEILFNLYPFDFATSEREVFLKSMAENPEFALESYVELADRAGVLRQALDETVALSSVRKLQLVQDAFARWQAAERRVIFETPVA